MTRAQARVVTFLRRPPLPIGVSFGYRLLFEAVLPTIPTEILDTLALTPSPRFARAGSAFVQSLRWALGHSPAWHLALVRTGAPVPPGLFTQPLGSRSG